MFWHYLGAFGKARTATNGEESASILFVPITSEEHGMNMLLDHLMKSRSVKVIATM